jgi:hypothetical protein
MKRIGGCLLAWLLACSKFERSPSKASARREERNREKRKGKSCFDATMRDVLKRGIKKETYYPQLRIG